MNWEVELEGYVQDSAPFQECIIKASVVMYVLAVNEATIQHMLLQLLTYCLHH